MRVFTLMQIAFAEGISNLFSDLLMQLAVHRLKFVVNYVTLSCDILSAR